MKTKLSSFIVRKSVTGIESMDFRSAPVRFKLFDPHRGFFRFLRYEGYLLDSNYAKIIFEKWEQSAFAYAVKK